MVPITHTEMIKLLLSPGSFLHSFPWSTSTLAHGFPRSGTGRPLPLLPALTSESLPSFFQEKKPHLFFQIREEIDHGSPSALAVFQVLLERLGLSPLRCSFLGLHKLHPYHPSLIRALGPTCGASVTPLHLGDGARDRQHILLSLSHTCGRNFVA